MQRCRSPPQSSRAPYVGGTEVTNLGKTFPMLQNASDSPIFTSKNSYCSSKPSPILFLSSYAAFEKLTFFAAPPVALAGRVGHPLRRGASRAVKQHARLMFVAPLHNEIIKVPIFEQKIPIKYIVQANVQHLVTQPSNPKDSTTSLTFGHPGWGCKPRETKLTSLFQQTVVTPF